MISLVSLLLATPNTITVPGTLIFQNHHPTFHMWGFEGQRVQILEEPPPELILPNDLSQKVTALSFVIGTPPQTRYAVYAREEKLLYVDSDGNNSIKDEPPLHEEHWSTYLYQDALTFGPFRLSVPCNGKNTSRYFTLARYKGKEEWRLFSEDIRQFKVKLNGQVKEFALIDTNADGIFAPGAPGQRREDALYWLPEIDGGYIPKYLPVGESTYKVEVEPDGSAVHFTLTDLPTGFLSIEEGECTLALKGQQVGIWRARANQEGVRQPADHYKVLSYQWNFTKDSERWELRVYLPEKDPPELEISKDKVTRWKIEKRLVATLTLQKQETDNIWEVFLQVRTTDNGEVSTLLKNHKLPPEPKLKVQDKNGRVILTETFHYG